MQKNRSLLMFYVPLVYSLCTRYKGKIGVSAWIIKYIIPISFIGLGLQDFSFEIFVLGLLYLYAFYEIGYIQNDCETIKKEENPTMRISESERLFYERNKFSIYFFRTALFVLFGGVLYSLGTAIALLIYGFATLLVFLFYNKIRNGFCLVVHVVLMMLRYTVPLFIAINRFDWLCFLLCLFIYPLTLFIERSVKGKFGYKSKFLSTYVMHTYDERYSFRLRYYSVLFLLSILFSLLDVIPVLYIIPMGLLLLTSWQNVKSGKLHYNK